MISLRILLALPKAHRNDSLGVAFRSQSDQVHKPRLFLQDGQDVIAQFIVELIPFFWFYAAFHNAGKHRKLLSHSLEVKTCPSPEPLEAPATRRGRVDCRYWFSCKR